MEKRPLLPVDTDAPLQLWYEGPSYLLAIKPAGVPVHPHRTDGRGTLVNALLRDNRWLAEMEHSVAPGVVHRLRDADQGLMVLAVDDEEGARLRRAHSEGAMRFRFRLRLPAGVLLPAEPPAEWAGAVVHHRRDYGECVVWDVEAPTGDTPRLTAALPEAAAQECRWFCYRIEVPEEEAEGRRVWELGRPLPLPRLDLYTAPT